MEELLDEMDNEMHTTFKSELEHFVLYPRAFELQLTVNHKLFFINQGC